MATAKTESKMHLAVVSGLFATSGGVLGKLAGFYEMSDFWSLMAKVILLLAMVTSNTIGCTLFVKALAGSGSSLPATVASSTVNYFCSVSESASLVGYNTGTGGPAGLRRVDVVALVVRHLDSTARAAAHLLLAGLLRATPPEGGTQAAVNCAHADYPPLRCSVSLLAMCIGVYTLCTLTRERERALALRTSLKINFIV
ncbi:uncharacterized protein LOC100116165 isoform X1 [Nasonia vitripennis]|uniref:Uncharacterized protein n=1 Tax=Nasonia vitripennis TaxID=7425 RepID=A0A7M7J289_NASVI|nr:uncharacterized protein LOC100116165 isoform X1 [Nasonia vitripennis]XP_016843202.1 uncharacterized protein LOC100116165 isoform X1 [Nasonia vitripennis]XP_016843207.1 uncharacterized protein LOC100116165 isoform X1 [Nasonia vitripennis]XP_016843211.1 uncharacterized protein LOC100116165 isoform X1 [Nasonia vitripennis]XP_016843212.1 uncharacterized protein LOC100116165 isoform X1 [Nasonia vitripennis]XP_016843214.1 uncharacterized protein LOC100116165 isoform X1 [Nasonia vitripennis]XP_03